MILVITRMKISAARRLELSQTIASLIGSMRTEPGCRRFEFCQNVENKNELYLILWLLGLISGYTMGGVVHVLLVIAIVVIVIQVIQGRRRLQSFGALPENNLGTNNLTSKLQIGVTAMKKKHFVIRYFVLLALIAFLAACASTRTQESTGEYVDDSVITTKVKSLLAADDFLKSFQIGVESFKGVVQLSGFVNTQKAVDKAIEITRSVKGVRSVKNDLIVK
jgi:hypothetical protein